MRRVLRAFSADDAGATAIEYGLILVLIFLVIVGGLSAVASASNNKFNTIGAAIGNTM